MNEKESLLPNCVEYAKAQEEIERQWKERHRKEYIPVEWIKKKLDRLKDDIKWAWYYGNTTLKEMEWAETWVQVVLLEEWEKRK